MPTTKRGPFILNGAPSFDNPAWLNGLDDAAFRFSNDVFNVKDKDYGAVGDGSTNDTTAVQAAVDACIAAGGGIVFFPKGIYKLDGLTWTSTVPVDIIGAGIGRTVLRQNANASVVLAQGSQGSAIALTANASKGDTSLSFNTSGFAAGDYIVLYSSTAWTLSATGGQFGEILRLQSITSGSAAALYSAVDSGPYNTAASASVRKLNFIEGMRIANLTIENPSPGTRTSPAVNLRWVKNGYFHFAAKGIDGPGLALNSCLGGHARIYAQDLTDDTANSRFGYGVSVINCSRDMDIYVEADNCRHAVTTDTTGSGSPGVPRHIRFRGIARNCNAASWDTHADGEHIVFDQVIVDGAKGAGAEVAVGIQVRCPNVTIIAPDIAGTRTHAIRTRYDSTASSGMNGINCTILGGRIHDLVGSVSALYNSGAAGFRVLSPMVFENVAGNVITNDNDNAGTPKQMYVHPYCIYLNSGTSTAGTAAALIDRLPTGGVRSYSQAGGGTLSIAGRDGLVRVAVGDATNFTLSFDSNYTPQLSAEIDIEIYNNSGGAMGTVTFDAAKFRQAGFTSPASTKVKTCRFRWDTNFSRWMQVGSWSADI